MSLKRNLFSFILLLAFAGAFSQTRTDSLLNELKSVTGKNARVELLNKIAVEFTKTSPEKGVGYAREALKEAQAAGDKKGIGTALFNLGLCNDYMSQYDTALAYHLQGLKIREELGDVKAIAESYNNLGIINYFKGNYDDAILYYKKTIELSAKTNDKKNAAKALNNLGSIYEKKGDFNSATEAYLRALEYNNDTGDKLQAGLTTLNLGLIEYQRENYPAAKRLYFQAKKIQEEIGDQRGLATSLNNLAGLYTHIRKNDSATFFFGESFKLYEQTNDKYGMAHALGNMGSLEFQKGNYTAALAFFMRTVEMREAMGDKQGAAFTYKNVGNAYKKLRKFGESEKYFFKGLALAQQLNARVVMKDIYSDLSDLYLVEKEYLKAHQYLMLHTRMKDTILNEESARQLAEMNTRFETEKKDKELIKKDAELTMKTAQAEKQNLQRNAFIVGFLLVAILALFIFRSYRQKHRDNEIITLQKEEVEKQNKLIEEQKSIVEQQKELVEEKQKEVMDSIHYAQRIQRALLAGKDLLDKELQPDHYFVFFNPKDIVSGDFYWATTVRSGESADDSTADASSLTAHTTGSIDNNSELFYLAVCDSTGHGVPGAFMSLLNIGFLSEAIKEKDILETDKILNYVRSRLINTISKEGQQDGFDGILLRIDKCTKTLSYSAAHNAPLLVSAGEAVELPSDKMPVGKGERTESFKCHTINYNPGDMLYLYTDGYADQFGGPKGKKFKYKQLNDLLVSISGKPTSAQSDILSNTLSQWKGSLEQIDDILVVGIRL